MTWSLRQRERVSTSIWLLALELRFSLEISMKSLVKALHRLSSS